MEIHRLHDMLTAAGIEHEWRDRTPPGWDRIQPEMEIDWGWQVIVWENEGEPLVSAIEGYGTYGYMNYLDPERPGDLIEIMGLLTPEEAEDASVVGFLTADEVFARIRKALEVQHGENMA